MKGKDRNKGRNEVFLGPFQVSYDMPKTRESNIFFQRLGKKIREWVSKKPSGSKGLSNK